MFYLELFVCVYYHFYSGGSQKKKGQFIFRDDDEEDEATDSKQTATNKNSTNPPQPSTRSTKRYWQAVSRRHRAVEERPVFSLRMFEVLAMGEGEGEGEEETNDRWLVVLLLIGGFVVSFF